MISLRALAGAILASALLLGTAPAAEAAARPGNGRVLYAGLSGGEGHLKVKNGTTRDAVVTLVRGKQKALSFYIRARSNATLKGVVDGTYRVYYTTGTHFSTSKKRFTRSATYRRFDSSLRYRTTSRSATIWTLTLKPAIGGNATTSGVDPKDFPS
ncbi:hypothetical protein [Nonomuraea africana]|uniref:Uncharacterized protein n=1 Tax=Nonomuraea africana TaxID=46171 RepID=A0ABR9KUI7_9ACTN|nr:hypothetical protein [Nonomuraea africana]MBE1565410.1 hypothetical protein [Nonomuraea africana]